MRTATRAQILLLAGCMLAFRAWAQAGSPPHAPAAARPASARPAAPPPAQAPRGHAEEFRVEGQVGHPLVVRLEDLRALPAVSVRTSFLEGGRAQTHLYRGVTLFTLLRSAQPAFDPRRREDAFGWGVLAEGSDGYRAAFAWAEMDTSCAREPVLVAYERDGHRLTADGGAFTLVVPGDVRAVRYVEALRSLRIVPLANR